MGQSQEAPRRERPGCPLRDLTAVTRTGCWTLCIGNLSGAVFWTCRPTGLLPELRDDPLAVVAALLCFNKKSPPTGRGRMLRGFHSQTRTRSKSWIKRAYIGTYP